MSKNIVICCDGTRGKYESEDKNTNVVRLFERLIQDGPAQISYCDQALAPTAQCGLHQDRRWPRDLSPLPAWESRERVSERILSKPTDT